MAYQQKEGQGSLFKNEKNNDRQPDYKGSIMIKGVLYEVAAWERTSQNGKNYLSLQASEKGQDAPRPAAPSTSTPQSAAPAPTAEDMPEDLPF